MSADRYCDNCSERIDPSTIEASWRFCCDACEEEWQEEVEYQRQVEHDDWLRYGSDLDR